MLIYDRTIPTTSHNEEKQLQNLSNHIFIFSHCFVVIDVRVDY